MRYSTLNQWLTWQQTLHPLEIDLGLQRIQRVYAALTQKPPAKTMITVAGTNGKGSSICYLESILAAAGYRVGCYTSPHLYHYNERIRIAGKNVSDNELCLVFDKIDRLRGRTSLTYFEFGTLAALAIMAEQSLDVALLEVGLGGRLDAVNVIDADVALITTIGIDHEQWLGCDRESIAIEKAGIMRSHKAAVYSDVDPVLSIALTATAKHSKLFVLDKEFNFTRHPHSWDWHSTIRSRYGLPLPNINGQHQLVNAAGVLMVLELVADKLPVAQADIRAGLHSASLAGRLEYYIGEINTLIDVAHNPLSAQALAAHLRQASTRCRYRIVVGLMADKDIDNIIQPLLDLCEQWYVTDIANSRAIGAQQLCSRITTLQKKTNCLPFTDVQSAYRQARQDCAEGEQIVVFGSFYLLAECQTMLSKYY